MRKIIGSGLLLGIVFLLSGCVALPNKSGGVNLSGMTGGVIRSDDHGKVYKPAVKVDEKKNISGVQTLSLAMDSNDTKKIYLGSLEDGIFITRDGGENWTRSDVPIQKNYALVLHPSDPNVAYATGVYNGRGKVAKTIDGGVEWKEVYTEPADGTVILSLAMNANMPEKVYAGTSDGMIIVTQDGGATWANLFKAQKPVRSLSVDRFDGNIVYAMTFQDAMLLSRDGGKTFVDIGAEWRKRQDEKRKDCKIGEKCSVQSIEFGSVYTYALDPQVRGRGYLGTNKGILRFTEYGNNWEEVNIIASSKAFPILAIAVNPQNSSEMYYSSAQAIYRTTDGGVSWFPFQLDADSVSVSVMILDGKNPEVIYVGLREGGK
jgi:photosystem II stability/assembly factor-like uncharacterized protein